MHLKSGAQLTTDSGYQGLAKLQVNSVLPKKSTLIEARPKAEQKYLKKTYHCLARDRLS